MALMRSIWKGDLSFGLVNVPVKVYSATESHDRKSYQVDSSDGTRIRYRRVREGTDTEVDYGDIANAYESESGETVILTKEDLASLPVQKSPEISILEFVPAEQVDPIYFDKPYYLEPSSKSPKAYVLLAKALEETDRLAIASFTLRNRTRVAALRVVDGVMTLQTLLWPDEVRKPDFGFLDDDTEIRDQELQMAASLIESMASDYDPSECGEAFPESDDEDKDTEDSDVADLLAALRASVKDRGGSDSKDSDSKDTAAKKAPAKKAAAKTTAKKAPAKKTASRSTAKKTSSGSSGSGESGSKSTAKKAPAKKSSRKAS
jgi:DNA end-binding protein Ku